MAGVDVSSVLKWSAAGPPANDMTLLIPVTHLRLVPLNNIDVIVIMHLIG